MRSKAPCDAAAEAPCARLGEVLLDSRDSCFDRRKIESPRHEQAAHNKLKLQAQLAQPQLHQKLSTRPPDFWMPLEVVVWRLGLTGLTRLVRLSS